MSKVLGYSIIAHREDGSTETVTKIPGERITLAPVGAGGARGKYNRLNADECPEHGPWKGVPAGVSKKTGKSYEAFYTCVEDGCLNRPTKDWEETHPVQKPEPAEESWGDVDF